MSDQPENITDRHIISMLAENNLQAWELIYDKYAPAMYGMICKLTDDETIAGEIFKEAFLQLKEKNILSNINYSLCPFLLRHTHIYATKQLKQYGIDSTTQTAGEEINLIHLLCAKSGSLKDAAFILNINEEEARKKLRAEFLELRNQKKNHKPVYQQTVFAEQYSYNYNATDGI